jgi:DNA modification methylase
MSIFPFTTTHNIYTADARFHQPNNTIDLIVTSPPYPMIEMWDTLFSDLNPEITSHINTNSYTAFEKMHSELDTVWEQCAAALSEDGIICVNIGNATRTTDDLGFTLFHNRERIVNWFTQNGFTLLPSIIWQKPSNKPNSFLGSGCIPPNAYVTNDHEYILIFRKSDGRDFEPNSDHRYMSGYFYEERNKWFSGIWRTVQGVDQYTDIDAAGRDQNAAFPFELPYRLILMYSVYEDTVYDPFGGTGTTQLAAAVTGRNSVSVDVDSGLKEICTSRLQSVPDLSEVKMAERLANHREFCDTNNVSNYTMAEYDLPVKTKLETDIQLSAVSEVTEKDSETVICTHKRFPSQ